MAEKYTPEPWEEGFASNKIQLERLGEDPHIQMTLSVADYARARACVNACEGINPEKLPELLEVVQAAARGSIFYNKHALKQNAQKALAAVGVEAQQ